MRFRTLGLVAAGLLLITATSTGAMPGGNGHGKGPRSCDDGMAAAARDAVMAACPCDTAVNHGQFVSCVSRTLASMIRDGSVARPCRKLARKGIARSTCGKSGFVTCCRTGVSAGASCTVKSDAATCEAVGGTVGSSAMCLDACPVASPSGAFLDPSTDALF